MHIRDTAMSICSSGVLRRLRARQLRFLVVMMAHANGDGEIYLSKSAIIHLAMGRRAKTPDYEQLKDMERLGVIEPMLWGRDRGYRLRPPPDDPDYNPDPLRAQADPHAGLVRLARRLARRRTVIPRGRRPAVEPLVRQAIAEHGEAAVEALLQVGFDTGLAFDAPSWLRDPRRTFGLLCRAHPEDVEDEDELDAREREEEREAAVEVELNEERTARELATGVIDYRRPRASRVSVAEYLVTLGERIERGEEEAS